MVAKVKNTGDKKKDTGHGHYRQGRRDNMSVGAHETGLKIVLGYQKTEMYR